MVTAVRKFLIFLVAVAAVIAAALVFLFVTTPRHSAGVRIPLGARERALIAHVPQSAEAFAIIPTAAAFESELNANPVTRTALESWRATHRLPRGWMTGSADLAMWKSGNEIGWFLDLDPVRALLVRAIGIDVSGGAEGPRLDPSAMPEIDALASRLPPGDALVVQRDASRGAYPPLSRPAVTSVRITPAEILLTSVGAAQPARDGVAAGEVSATPFPRSAVISAWFAHAPRLIGDLNRLFGAKVSSLVEDGGMISIYDVDTRRLLPRPIGVIAVPSDAVRASLVQNFAQGLGGIVRTGETNGMLLISFDDSIAAFERDGFDSAPRETGEWAVRIDPARMVPILKRLAQNVGLRILAPRLFRSARDLDRWIGGLEQAKTIEGTDSTGGGTEVLRVRIVSK